MEDEGGRGQSGTSCQPHMPLAAGQEGISSSDYMREVSGGYYSVSGLPPEGSAPLEVLCLAGMDLMFWVWSGVWSQNRLALFWVRGLLDLV